MTTIKNLTAKYSAKMSFYNMAYAGFSAYGTVYLLAKDFNNAEIGLITALANVLAAIIQPLLANWADRSEKISLHGFSLMLIIPTVLLLLNMYINNDSFFLIGIQFMLTFTLILGLQPILNAVSMFFINQGYSVNYGFSRAIGSLFYAAGSSILGIITVRWGMDAMLLFAIAAYILYTIALFSMPIRWAKNNPKTSVHEDVVIANHENEFEMPVDMSALPTSENFFKRYRNFMIVNVGIVMFFAFHSLVNTYMFQILTNVGGNASHLGWAFAVGAVVELPIMMNYEKIAKYITHEQAMMISSFTFFIKAVITLSASSVTGIFAAQVSQAVAFALYAVVSVYYTNTVMQPQDKVKGQAILTTSHTIGGIIGTLIGGLLIEQFSVTAALIFCVVMTIGGIICFWIGLRDRLTRKISS